MFLLTYATITAAGALAFWGVLRTPGPRWLRAAWGLAVTGLPIVGPLAWLLFGARMVRAARVTSAGASAADRCRSGRGRPAFRGH